MSLAPNPATDDLLSGVTDPPPAFPVPQFDDETPDFSRFMLRMSEHDARRRTAIGRMTDDEVLSEYLAARRTIDDLSMRASEVGTLGRFAGGFMAGTIGAGSAVVSALGTQFEALEGPILFGISAYDRLMGRTPLPDGMAKQQFDQTVEGYHRYADHLRLETMQGQDDWLPESVNAMLNRAVMDGGLAGELGMILANALPSAATLMLRNGTAAQAVAHSILAFYGTMGFGHGVQLYRDEMLSRGVEPDITEAMMVGVGYGVAEMAVERLDMVIPWNRMSTGGAHMVAESLMRRQPGRAARFIANSVGFGLTEAGEEILTGVLQDAWATATYGREFEIDALGRIREDGVAGFAGSQFVTMAGLANRRTRRMLTSAPPPSRAQVDRQLNDDARQALQNPTGRMLAISDALAQMGQQTTMAERVRIGRATVDSLVQAGVDPASAAMVGFPRHDTTRLLSEYRDAAAAIGVEIDPQIARVSAADQATIDLWAERGIQIVPIEADPSNPLPGFASETPGVVFVEMGSNADSNIVQAVLMHEIVHTLQDAHPDVFRTLVETVPGSVLLAAQEQQARLAQAGVDQAVVEGIADPVATIREGSATLIDMIAGEAGLTSLVQANPTGYAALRDILRRTITRLGLRGPTAKAVLTAFREIERRGFGREIAVAQDSARGPRRAFTARPESVNKRLAAAYEQNRHRPNAVEKYRRFAAETIAQYATMVANGQRFIAYEDKPPTDAGDAVVFPVAVKPDSIETLRSANPIMYASSGMTDANGVSLTVADVFNAVHATHGTGEAAWRSHGRRYSADALSAMTGFTRLREAWEQVNAAPAQEGMVVAPAWAYKRIRPLSDPVPTPTIVPADAASKMPPGTPVPPSVLPALTPSDAPPQAEQSKAGRKANAVAKRVGELAEIASRNIRLANELLPTVRTDLAATARNTLPGPAGLALANFIGRQNSAEGLRAAAEVLFVAQVHASVGLDATTRSAADRLKEIEAAIKGKDISLADVRAKMREIRNTLRTAAAEQAATLKAELVALKKIASHRLSETTKDFAATLSRVKAASDATRQQAVAKAVESARTRHADAVELLEAKHAARMDALASREAQREALFLKNVTESTALLSSAVLTDSQRNRLAAKIPNLTTEKRMAKWLARLAVESDRNSHRTLVAEATAAIAQARKIQSPAARRKFVDLLSRWGIDAKNQKKIPAALLAKIQGTEKFVIDNPDAPLTSGMIDELHRASSKALRDFTASELATIVSELGVVHAIGDIEAKAFRRKQDAVRAARDHTAAAAVGESTDIGKSVFSGSTVLRRFATRAMMRPDTLAMYLFGENGTGWTTVFRAVADAARDRDDAFYRSDVDPLMDTMRSLGYASGTNELAGWGRFTADQQRGLGTVSPNFHTVKIGGQSLNLTSDQITSVLGMLKDTEIRTNLMRGAPLLINNLTVSTKESTRQEPFAVQINAEDIVRLQADFAGTAEASLAQFMFDHFNGAMRQEYAEWSIAHENADLSRDNYWPAPRDKEIIKNFTDDSGDARIDGASLNRRRKGSKTLGYVVREAVPTFFDHTWQMRSITRLADAVDDARHVVASDGLRRSLVDRGLDDMLPRLHAILNQHVRNARGTNGHDPSADPTHLAAWLRNKAVVGFLGLNPAVMLYQPVSLLVASSEIDGMLLASSIPAMFSAKNDAAMMRSPLLRQRADQSATNLIKEGQTHRGGMLGFRNAIDPMRGIGGLDWMAMRAIWNAATLEVKATNTSLAGDALLDAVARRTEQIVERTQPISGADFDSGVALAARNNPVLGWITMFTNQPNQNYNIAARALIQMRDGGGDEKKKAARVFMALIGQSLLVALIRTTWRDIQSSLIGKESKDTRSFVNRWLTNAAATTTGTVYGGAEVGQAMEWLSMRSTNRAAGGGYTPGMDVSPMVDIINGTFSNLYRTVDSIGQGDILRAQRDGLRFLESAAGLAGVPMSATRPFRQLYEVHVLNPAIQEQERRRQMKNGGSTRAPVRSTT
jgi:hypothetical protein